MQDSGLFFSERGREKESSISLLITDEYSTADKTTNSEKVERKKKIREAEGRRGGKIKRGKKEEGEEGMKKMKRGLPQAEKTEREREWGVVCLSACLSLSCGGCRVGSADWLIFLIFELSVWCHESGITSESPCKACISLSFAHDRRRHIMLCSVL